MLSNNESVQLSSGLVISHEHFTLQRPGKPEIKAEIDFLNGMLYIWIGLASFRQLNNLQIAYPGTSISSASCKLIIGDDSFESSNQLMTKRLSQKFGRPVMLSFNYEINETNEPERFEIFKWILSIVEPRL